MQQQTSKSKARIWRSPTSPHLPKIALDPQRAAVLLNANARRVNDKLAKRIADIVGAENVFYSHSLAEAEYFTQQIVQKCYGTVICGGGDGTIINAYNMLANYLGTTNAWRAAHSRRSGQQPAPFSMPRLAFLSLGTGNALKHVVGAQDPLQDLRQITQSLSQKQPLNTQNVDLIRWQDSYFTFGGLGYDSILLNDYNAMLQKFKNPLTRPLLQSVGGYFAALFWRTLPRILAHGQQLIARITTDSPAYYIDPRRGDAACEITAGQLLYEGPLSLLGVGTTPFFGYGMRVFPFASLMPGMMQLRLGTLPPIKTLANLPSIWQGHYRNPAEIRDFWVRRVNITLTHPYPFQHSGDDQGMVSQIDLSVAENPLKLVSLHKNVQ